MKVWADHRGFTLIEMIVVFSLLAIVMAIAAPSFRNMRFNAQLRDSARAVANQIQEVRSLAIRDGRPHRIQCDPSVKTCLVQSVFYDSSDDTWKANTLSSFTFPEDVLMRTGANCDKSTTSETLAIEFFPNGNAEIRSAFADPAVCVNASSTDARFRIRLISLSTGKVVIEQP